MPITQDRLITIVNAASAIVDVFTEIRLITKADAAIIISNINSVIDHTSDNNAKVALTNALGLINRLQSIIIDTDIIAAGLTAELRSEQKHFAKRAKANYRSAQHQRQARREAGITPRETTNDSIPQPLAIRKSQGLFTPSSGGEAIMSDEELRASADYQRFQQEMAKRYATATPPVTTQTNVIQPTVPETIKRVELPLTQAMKDYLAGRISSLPDNEPSAQLSPAQDETPAPFSISHSPVATQSSAQDEAQAETETPAPLSSLGKLKVNTSAGASYDKNVLRTSVPSLDELNKSPLTPGTNIF